MRLCKTTQPSKGPKQMAPLQPVADLRDYTLCCKVIQVLDDEFGLKNNWKEKVDSIQSVYDKLEYLVKYMWRVFGYSFYGAIKCEDER